MMKAFNTPRAKHTMPPHLSTFFYELVRESPILLELVCYSSDTQRTAGVLISMIVLVCQCLSTNAYFVDVI